jgi:predicted enzyme related to lactoylglutathione lyase
MTSGDREATGHERGPHLFGHGRLSYLQIPAADVRASGDFYVNVFGWQLRGGSDVHLSFTDATGDMIGAWVTDQVPSQTPGVLPYIYVHGIDATLERVAASGGEVVRPPYPEGDLWAATFRDPAGNVIGIWQQGPR